MIRRQRDEQVEARAALILDGDHAAEAYAEHFDVQMRRSTVTRLLSPPRVNRIGVLVLVLAALLAATVLLGAAAGHVAQRMLAGANGVVAVNTASGRLLAETPLAASPGAVSDGDGSVWVADPGTGQVSRFGPGSGVEVGRILVGGEPGGIVSGDGAIWVASTAGATVTRIDPVSQSVTQRIPLPGGSLGAIAFGAGGLWVADPAAHRLFEVDPATGSLERTLPVDLQPSAIAATATAIWVAGYGKE